MRGLGLGRERTDGHGARGQRGPDDCDLVVDEQLLRRLFGVVGNAAIVLDDEIDLPTSDGGAILVHVELDAGQDLLADGCKSAGERQHDTDLHVLSKGSDGRRSRKIGGRRRHHFGQIGLTRFRRVIGTYPCTLRPIWRQSFLLWNFLGCARWGQPRWNRRRKEEKSFAMLQTLKLRCETS